MRNSSIKFQNPILNFVPTDVWTSLFQYAPSTFQSCDNNKISRLYIDLVNYLSYQLYCNLFFLLSNRFNPDQAALTRAADLCLPWLKKC